METIKESERFELTDEKKVNVFGIELFRIKVIKTFKHKLAGEIKKGSLGGWVESLDKLKDYNNVYGNAWVSGNAEVYGDAKVYGKCKIKIRLCSRFSFEFQWQIDKWIKLEKQFEEESNGN